MAARYEIEILGENDGAAWDKLVRSTPQHTLFGLSAWRESYTRLLGKEWRVYGCLKNGNLVAGCAALRVRRGGMEFLLPPLLTGYPGFFVQEAEGATRHYARIKETTERVSHLEEAVRKSSAVARFVHHPSLVDLRPFAWNGWETVPRYTFRINLVPREEMLASFRHDLRKSVRKGEENGLVVKRADDIERVAGMWASSYGRHGEPPPIPVETLAAWYRRLAGEGTARAYVAEGPDGRAHAFRIALVGEGGAFDWVAGSDPALLSKGGTPWLLTRIMDDLRAEGFDSFDLMGANTPTIASFKTGFGGELVPYGETGWCRSFLAKGLVEGKNFMRRLLPR